MEVTMQIRTEIKVRMMIRQRRSEIVISSNLIYFIDAETNWTAGNDNFRFFSMFCGL